MTSPNDPSTAGVRPSFREHPFEFVLRLFGEVRPGEGGTVLLLTANVFVLLCAYYLLKVAREPLILLGGGAEVKSYASVGQAILLIFVANGYSWLAGRVGRIPLIATVTLFFAANLVVFWILGERGVPLGIPFFLWVGVFNIVTTAQFWSFAADTYTEEQGKRLFPIVGIGSSVGAVGGSAIADPLIKVGSPFMLMLLAAAMLIFALGLTVLVNRRELAHPTQTGAAPIEEPLGHGNAFALILKDRYLLLVAALVLVMNTVTKTGDYVLDRMLVLKAPVEAQALGIKTAVYIGQFKARYFEAINVLTVVSQLFLVSRAIKYLGLRKALVLVPLASLSGYGIGFAAPLIGVLFVGRIVESGFDYSLSNTTRQALWLVTSRDAKYKAKQVIDTFVMRGGDALSAALVWFGTRAAMTARSFLFVNVVLSITWVAVALFVGSEYRRRSADATTAPQVP